jgi:uncharacterized protein
MKNAILFFLVPLLFLNAQTELPVLKSYANDFTNTLTEQQLSSINSTLKLFDDSTSNQIVFLMIPSIDGSSLEDFTYQVATKNKIGSAKHNNGLLFFIAKDDHKMRIEVGYGLEGVFPDALAASILRNEVRPYFKQGDYYSGIVSGLNAIISATRGEYNDTKEEKNNSERGFPVYFIIMLVFIVFSIFRRGGRGGGGLLPWIILGSLGGGRSQGGWGGSSGGSGGFGGFSGGGGSFGGGGASGGW